MERYETTRCPTAGEKLTAENTQLRAECDLLHYQAGKQGDMLGWANREIARLEERVAELVETLMLSRLSIDALLALVADYASKFHGHGLPDPSDGELAKYDAAMTLVEQYGIANRAALAKAKAKGGDDGHH